jgi:ankyrin repeat protein
MVKELVYDWEADIEAKDYLGWTPLHCACHYGYMEVVIELVSAGEHIRVVNNNGKYPIDTALRGVKYGVFKYLLQELYASISDHDGRLPIHALLEDLSTDETSIREVLEHDYDAFDTDAILEIIAFLVDQDPESLIARNQDGQLPLHVACATLTDLDIIEFLVEQSPESLLVPRTTDGAYPLHVALERGASSDTEVIEMLLERHDPVTMMLRNNVGETPLHATCRCGVPFEIVQSLVDHYKASVQAVTPQGDLPLFLASATVLPSLDVIYLLLKLYPDAVYP